jgi:hypothetical protein
MSRTAWGGKVVLLMTIVALGGCLHRSPTYPGSRASGINPADYLHAPCPDFSGMYEGIGTLVKGKNVSEQHLAFYFLFPDGAPQNTEERERVRRNHIRPKGPPRWVDVPIGDGTRSKRLQVGGQFMEADYAKVTKVGPRSLEITLGYKSGTIGAYHSDYTDPKIYICKDGKVMSGGPAPGKTRSDMGRTQWFGQQTFYKDDNGDLILERGDQVDMNVLFAPIGSVMSYGIYRFKRIPPPEATLAPTH